MICEPHADSRNSRTGSGTLVMTRMVLALHCFRLFDRGQELLCGRIAGRVLLGDALFAERENNVVSRHRRTVVENHAIPQCHLDGLGIDASPGRRQARNELASGLVVDRNQRVIHVVHDPVSRVELHTQRIETSRNILQRNDHGPGLCIGCCRRTACDSSGERPA